MRICFIAQVVSIHTRRWVRYFADNGHKVDLISPTPMGEGNIGSTELHILKRFPLQVRIISFPTDLLSFITQIRILVRKIKPEIMHAHYITDCGFWGALSGFHPLVVSAWGSDILIDPKQHALHKVLTRYALRKADLITADGNNIIEEMIKLGGDPNKMHLIHHGIDTEQFKPQNESLEEEPTPSDSPVVITTRNLNPIYDLETLIKSVPLVLKQIPEVRFIIAGRGTQKDYLMDLAKSLDVMDSIRFVGNIPHEQLPSYLATADVYVSTSLSEGGISVSLAEAMSCGLAPIVTDVGDNRKWINNGENGFVIPVKSPKILAEKTVYLLENRKLRVEMGKANRQIIQMQQDFRQQMEHMNELYEDLIGRCNR